MTSQNFPDYPSYFHSRIDISSTNTTKAIPFTKAELTENLYQNPSTPICSTPDCLTQSLGNNFFKSNFYVYGAILSGSQSLQYDSTPTSLSQPWTCNDNIEAVGPTPYADWNTYTCTSWENNRNLPCRPWVDTTNVWNNKIINPKTGCEGCANLQGGADTGAVGGLRSLACPNQTVTPKTNIGTQNCNIFCPTTNNTLSYPIIIDTGGTTTIPTLPSQDPNSLWRKDNATCMSGLFSGDCKPLNPNALTCAVNINPQYQIKCGDLKTQNTFKDTYNFQSSCTLGSSGVGKCYQPQTNNLSPDYSENTCILNPNTPSANENWSPKYVDDNGGPLPVSDNSGAIQCAYGAPVGMFQLLTGTKHDLWMKNFNWTSKENPGQVASFINSIVKGGKS